MRSIVSSLSISTIGILMTSGTLELSALQIYFGISQYTKMLKAADFNDWWMVARGKMLNERPRRSLPKTVLL